MADLQQARLMALVAAVAGSQGVSHEDFLLVPGAEQAAEPTTAETIEAMKQAFGL